MHAQAPQDEGSKQGQHQAQQQLLALLLCVSSHYYV
jgi:hypothetical protein